MSLACTTPVPQAFSFVEQHQTLSSVVVMPEWWEDETTPLQGNIVGIQAQGSRATANDIRFEQLMAQMEELVQSTRVKQQRNEVRNKSTGSC
ncbi:hypothetical protein FNV43_RR27318 [Rhamnella rubrinervis]|uniref:Uncharacterized protein n=1 Tax=Rhamnella rubrinervis TaxID=2594499 RepID=A0A8K0DP72_9ROSA|nr:hypothetical protein FNV43_RR27318 [Rhamnella rubrinervis]